MVEEGEGGEEGGGRVKGVGGFRVKARESWIVEGERRTQVQGSWGADADLPTHGPSSVEDELAKFLSLAPKVFVNIPIDEERIKLVLREAFDVASWSLGVQEAVTAGQNFSWDPGVFTRDAERFRRAGGLEALVKSIQSTHAADRLSLHRVRQWVPADDPDRHRIESLATRGMNLIVSPVFCPNGTPPPIRQLYKQVAGACNGMFQDLWRNDLAVILPSALAAGIHGVHYSAAHWAKKAQTPKGRQIFDSSGRDPATALNSEWAAQALEECYGQIVHPTLEKLVRMILRVGDRFGSANISLWKADLAKAFTLLDFNPTDVHLLACQLTDDLTLFYHSGLFGWVGTPFAFQVITRVLGRLINTRLVGEGDLYVDDLLAVSPTAEVEAEHTRATECMNGLLGSKAEAAAKFETGRTLDMIGWTINLDTNLVTIKRSNFLKTVYAFVTVDVKCVTLPQLQALASYSSRYSELIRIMKPYCSFLYIEMTKYQGSSSKSVTHKLSNGAVQVIRMWLLILLMTDLDPATFCRTIDSFRPATVSLRVCFDASLDGLGVSVLDVATGSLLAVTSSKFPFGVAVSDYQNVCEFCAVVVGFALIARLGFNGRSVALKGDSMSAMKWSEKERFRGTLGSRAASVFVVLGAAFNLTVEEIEHVAGVDNTIHDDLSRGRTPEQCGFTGPAVFNIGEDLEVWRLLILCDPTKSDSLTSHFAEVGEAVKKLKEASGTPWGNRRFPLR